MKFTNHIKENKVRLEDIPGLWYFDKDKNISSNKSAKMFENLSIHVSTRVTYVCSNCFVSYVLF